MISHETFFGVIGTQLSFDISLSSFEMLTKGTIFCQKFFLLLTIVFEGMDKNFVELFSSIESAPTITVVNEEQGEGKKHVPRNLMNPNFCCYLSSPNMFFLNKNKIQLILRKYSY